LDAELGREANDRTERLWVNPELRYRQRVELLAWFEDPARLRDGSS
jgi:hypothetical protein